jgi:hypothetical protein
MGDSLLAVKLYQVFIPPEFHGLGGVLPRSLIVSLSETTLFLVTSTATGAAGQQADFVFVNVHHDAGQTKPDFNPVVVSTYAVIGHYGEVVDPLEPVELPAYGATVKSNRFYPGPHVVVYFKKVVTHRKTY